DRFGSAKRRREAVKVVDLALRELGQNLQPPEALELACEIIAQVAEKVLGLAAGLLRSGPRLLRFALGAPRALTAEVGQHRGGNGDSCQYRAGRGDLPCARRRTPRCKLAFFLLGKEPFRGFARLALLTAVAARLDDSAKHIV